MRSSSVIFVAFVLAHISMSCGGLDTIRHMRRIRAADNHLAIPVSSTRTTSSLEKETSTTTTTDIDGYDERDGSGDDDDNLRRRNQTFPPKLPTCKVSQLDEGSVVLGFFIGVLIVFVVCMIVNWQIFVDIYEQIRNYIDGRRMTPFYSTSPRRNNKEEEDGDDDDDLVFRGAN